MMTILDLERLSKVKVESTNPSELINVEQVEINTTLPTIERMLDYLEKVKNPYCFLCGETPVKVSFTENEIELRIRLKEYFLSLKR